MQKPVVFSVLCLFTGLTFAGTSPSGLTTCFKADTLKSTIATTQCRQPDTHQLARALQYSALDNRFINAVCNSLSSDERSQCKDPQNAFSYYIEANALANIVNLGTHASQHECAMFNEDKSTLQHILTRYNLRHYCG